MLYFPEFKNKIKYFQQYYSSLKSFDNFRKYLLHSPQSTAHQEIRDFRIFQNYKTGTEPFVLTEVRDNFYSPSSPSSSSFGILLGQLHTGYTSWAGTVNTRLASLYRFGSCYFWTNVVSGFHTCLNLGFGSLKL